MLYQVLKIQKLEKFVHLILWFLISGGTSVNLSLQKAIQTASDNNIIAVSVAGNNGDSNDVTPRYPSSYKFSNTISG